MGDTFALTATNEEDKQPLPVNHGEERELKRVFDLLCDYSKKISIKVEINELQLQRNAQQAKINAQVASGLIISADRVDSTVQATIDRIEQLEHEIVSLESNPIKKVGVIDVTEIMKKLGHKPQRGEVEEMIWAVDEDLDMALSWSEFKLMFTRNISDRTGLEPSKMFHLIQFLIYDKNENGLVSVDETMSMLYARYGRSKMESKLKELFGSDLKETGREGGEITYARFVKAVEKTQMKVFWGTTKGRILTQRGALKKSDTN